MAYYGPANVRYPYTKKTLKHLTCLGMMDVKRGATSPQTPLSAPAHLQHNASCNCITMMEISLGKGIQTWPRDRKRILSRN